MRELIALLRGMKKSAVGTSQFFYEPEISISGFFNNFAASSILRCLVFLDSSRYECRPGNTLPVQEQMPVILPVLHDRGNCRPFDKRQIGFRSIVLAPADEKRLNNLLDREVVLFRKLVVAFVVRGNSHHGARAVRGEHVISKVYRYLLFCRGVNG